MTRLALCQLHLLMGVQLVLLGPHPLSHLQGASGPLLASRPSCCSQEFEPCNCFSPGGLAILRSGGGQKQHFIEFEVHKFPPKRQENRLQNNQKRLKKHAHGVSKVYFRVVGGAVCLCLLFWTMSFPMLFMQDCRFEPTL